MDPSLDAGYVNDPSNSTDFQCGQSHVEHDAETTVCRACNATQAECLTTGRKKCCATKQIAYVLCHGERMRPVSCPLSSSCPQAPNLQAPSTPAPGWVVVQHPGGTINNSDSITIGCADRITKPHDLSVHLNVATTEYAGVVAYHGGVSMTAWESSAPSVDNLAIVPIFPFQTQQNF